MNANNFTSTYKLFLHLKSLLVVCIQKPLACHSPLATGTRYKIQTAPAVQDKKKKIVSYSLTTIGQVPKESGLEQSYRSTFIVQLIQVNIKQRHKLNGSCSLFYIFQCFVGEENEQKVPRLVEHNK